MDKYHILGAGIVSVVSGLFWLGVNWLEVNLKALLRKKIAQRKARRAASDLDRTPRIGQ
jgi:uncharacterized membrane protein